MAIGALAISAASCGRAEKDTEAGAEIKAESTDQVAAPVAPTSETMKGMRFRVIHPGDAVTKDYRRDRVNFYLDENDQIKDIQVH
jgi:hypothetical protein